MIELLLGGAVAGAVSLFGYIKTRRFVRERLRFVELIQSPAAPVVAGMAAALVAAPVVGLLAFLPLIGWPTATAIIIGVGVGAGVNAGARDSKALPGV
jgi:hypothetical protein